MSNFHSSFMFGFFRRHLPAVALLQSSLAAGGDALNSAVCVSALAAHFRTVMGGEGGGRGPTERERFVKKAS